MGDNKIYSIEDYILQFPNETQEILTKLRQVIKESAPNAEEKISYQMPTYAQNGNLVHFAAYKNHIGFYPAPSAIEAFKQELSEYKGAKGSVQFPIEQPLPYELISRIVTFRVAENIKKTNTRRKRRGATYEQANE
ncbi:iron chaperone [Paenibacillus sp. sgz302251]|uniref:iron chaperone n=1 Tax=Paenibacillus sp. sgz302251 TaxID=3414493 RepID=UPI003C7B58C3